MMGLYTFLYVFVNEKYKMTAKILADSEDNARTRLPPLPPGEEWMLKENSTDPPWGEKPKAEMDYERGAGFYDEMDMDAFHEKLKEHIDWLQSYVDATQRIVNQFAFHDDIYWWKGMNLNEMQEKAEKYNDWMIDKTDGAIITISQEKWQECQAALKKFEAALVQLEIPERMEMHEQLEAARERVRNGLLQADAPLWFLRSLQRDLGVSEE